MSRLATFRIYVLVLASIARGQDASAQKQETVTITEPGIYSLANLYRAADTVAIVEVRSGDTESYDMALYKAKVIRKFKGPTEGQTIFLGPFVGMRLGWQYLVFLKDQRDPLTPKRASSASYGTVSYSKIFDEGYSSMEISYECGFKEKSSDMGCADAVRVCTDYIKIPTNLEVFPAMDADDVPFGCRHVRKAEMIPLVESLANPTPSK